IDPARERIYVRELVSHRITAFNLKGQKLWQLDKVYASALAVDEKTGNLWASGGESLKEGETGVFDPSRNEIAAYPFCEIDMQYDRHTDSFWLSGYEILNLGRGGEVRFRKPVEGWCCASLDLNPKDGSVWIVEREHPDVPRSKNRLWLLNADGSVR